MKFKYCILYVEDVRASMDFFCRAFGFEVKFIDEDGDFGELSTGETSISFASISLMTKLGKSPGSPNAKKPVFELAFETNSVEEDLKRAIAAGATLIQDIREETWGQTTAYVSDPNGYLIEFCTPIEIKE